MTEDCRHRRDVSHKGRPPAQCGARQPDLSDPEAAAGGVPPQGATGEAGSFARASARLRQMIGFTLVELLIVIAVIGALAAIAYPNYRIYIERAQIIKTVGDLKILEGEIILYFNDKDVYPASLDDIGRGGMLDLWGNPYQYTNISLDLADIENENAKGKGKGGGGGGGVGKFRSYLNTKPINTDFDIYSMGPDGKSARPLTSKNSYDDIIRGNNGTYMGVAREF